MRRIWPITGCALLAALAVALLPASGRAPAWIGLAAAYLGIGAFGITNLRSGIFARALTQGRADSSEVAVTYDDGPDPTATPALLDLLRTRNVHATFFVIGTKAREHVAIVKRCHAEGHLIGLHSDRHSTWTNFLRGRALTRELNACRESVEALTGTPATYYRPPFGLVNPEVHGVVRRLGLTLVGWSVRSFDTTRRTTPAVAARVLRRIRGGDIVLLHDGGQDPARVCALTTAILDDLARRGLAPVRIDEIDKAGEAGA